MKINSFNTLQMQPSFKADIYESTISYIFEGELRPKLKKAKTDKDKKDVLALAESVYKKALEIKTWDNNRVKIGNIYSSKDESCGLGIMRDSLFGISDIMIISPEKVKKDGWTKSFLNFTKEQYLEARKPKILEYVQNAINAKLFNYSLKEIKENIGKDSYKLFETEYLKIKKSKTNDFKETLKKKLEIIG